MDAVEGPCAVVEDVPGPDDRRRYQDARSAAAAISNDGGSAGARTGSAGAGRSEGAADRARAIGPVQVAGDGPERSAGPLEKGRARVQPGERRYEDDGSRSGAAQG